jgi:FtsH-binding integral membrane protein
VEEVPVKKLWLYGLIVMVLAGLIYAVEFHFSHHNQQLTAALTFLVVAVVSLVAHIRRNHKMTLACLVIIAVLLAEWPNVVMIVAAFLGVILTASLAKDKEPEIKYWKVLLFAVSQAVTVYWILYIIRHLMM